MPCDDGIIEKRPLIYASIDKLRLRQAPDLDAQTVHRLSLGEPVIYLNERTSFTTPVQMQGQVLQQPWLKVITIDSLEGWAYAGGLSIYKPLKEKPLLTDHELVKEYLSLDALDESAAYKGLRISQLEQDQDFVKEENGILTLKTERDSVVLKNVSDTIAKTFERFEYLGMLRESNFAMIAHFSERGRVIKLYNRQTARNINLPGIPLPSPHHKRWAVMDIPALDDPSRARILIYRISDNDVKRDFTYAVNSLPIQEQYIPVFPSWKSNTILDFSRQYERNGSTVQKPAHILLGENGWSVR